MRIPRGWGQAAVASISCVLFGAPCYATDLSGLWASDATVCGKVFEKDGNQFTFRRDSDIYGSGFIIDGNRIRRQMASCEIRSKREQGNVIHMIAACASDVMLQNIQVSVKVINDNKITRIFPGMPDITINYARCSL
jgi:hypothetical protein